MKKVSKIRPQLVELIIQRRQPEEALSQLLKAYDPVDERVVECYNMFNGIKSVIIADDNNRNKYYDAKLKAFIKTLPPGHKDTIALYDLLESSLRVQHRTYMTAQKHDMFKDYIVDAFIMQLRPIKTSYYDFVFPDNLARKAQWMKKARSMQLQDDVQHMTTDHKDAIVKRSFSILEDPSINSKDEYWAHVTALQVVSGRRISEIVVKLEWDDISGFPYQARVSGINKKLHDDEAFEIPLLVSFDKFDRNMKAVRAYEYYKDTPLQDSVHAQQQMTNSNKKREQIFGFRVIHSQIRDIYAEEAFLNRAISQFLPSASEALFKAKALSLSTDYIITPLSAYTRINFIDM